MNPTDPDSPAPFAPATNSFWRKLGGGSLSISLMVHAILLAIGVVWIFQVMPEKKEEQPTFQSGNQGGSPAPRAAMKMPSHAALSRLVAVNSISTISLPEQIPGTEIRSIGTLSKEAGPGGPVGYPGPHVFQPPGSGLPGQARLGPPAFGLPEPNANALVGTFYDTKQDPHRKPTGMTPEKLRDVIKEFTTRGWNERSLEGHYYKAPQTLYQTKIYIPEMSAGEAPKAFNCEKEVEPSRWMVIYRGEVTPPKSGKYRFVGAGDDVLVVRFNGQNVFDHGFTQGTTGLYVPGNVAGLAAKPENRDLAKVLRGGAMKLPITFYQYDTTQNWNKSIGGLAVGPEFEANAGSRYPIEILISEIPGGLFGASLLIQETGVTYQKASTGAPILPVFRLDQSVPVANGADNAPPVDTEVSPWKLTGTRAKVGI